MRVQLLRHSIGDYDNKAELFLPEFVDIIDIKTREKSIEYLQQFNSKATYGNLNELTNSELNRYIKFSPIQDAEFRFYIDGSISVMDVKFFKTCIDLLNSNNKEILFFLHPLRSSLHDEVDACFLLSKINYKERKNILKYISSADNPTNVTQNGFHLIKNTDESNNFLKAVSRNLANFYFRDQLVVPFTTPQTKVNIYYDNWPDILFVEKHRLGLFSRFKKKLNFLLRRLILEIYQ